MDNKNKDKRHLQKQSKTITRTGVITAHERSWRVVNGRYGKLETEDNKGETGNDKTSANLWEKAMVSGKEPSCETHEISTHP